MSDDELIKASPIAWEIGDLINRWKEGAADDELFMECYSNSWSLSEFIALGLVRMGYV